MLRRLSLLVAVVLLAAGCRTLQVDPVPAVPSDWTTEGGAPTRAAVGSSMPLPLEVAWVYDASAGFGAGSALVASGVVLVATQKGEVHAVDLETGGRVGLKNFGDAVEGTPAVRDGVLFVPVAWGRRAITAYDLIRATTRWTHRHPPIEAGLLLTDSQLVGVDVEGNVRSYDPASGDTLWRHPLGDGRVVHGAPLSTGGRLLVADDAGRVVALDERGQRLWTTELGAPIHATGAAFGGTAYYPTTRGELVALDAATGTVRWRYTAGDATIYLTAPAVDAADLAVGGSDGLVRLLDPATGALRWARDLGESVVGTPLLTPDHVFVGSTGEEVVALARTDGHVAWRAEVEGRVRSALAASGDRLVVLTDARNVYLFSPAADYATR